MRWSCCTVLKPSGFIVPSAVKVNYHTENSTENNTRNNADTNTENNAENNHTARR